MSSNNDKGKFTVYQECKKKKKKGKEKQKIEVMNKEKMNWKIEMEEIKKTANEDEKKYKLIKKNNRVIKE